MTAIVTSTAPARLVAARKLLEPGRVVIGGQQRDPSVGRQHADRLVAVAFQLGPQPAELAAAGDPRVDVRRRLVGVRTEPESQHVVRPTRVVRQIRRRAAVQQRRQHRLPAGVLVGDHRPPLVQVAAGQRRRHQAEVVQLDSPGGFGWCLVGHDGERTRTQPVRWPGGHRSLVDQLCLDIPPSRYDAECDFWSALTGWELRRGGYDDFGVLVRPESMPLRLLLQRTRDDDGPVRAHLDLVVVRRMPVWVTLRDPAGLDYCVTGRDPDTGLLR